MYIPFEGGFDKSSDCDMFTLQLPASGLDPNRVIKKFDCFKYNRYMNEFKFVNEEGVEFMAQCFRTDNKSAWSTVVSICCSNNVSKDINEFYNWLSENFILVGSPKRPGESATARSEPSTAIPPAPVIPPPKVPRGWF